MDITTISGLAVSAVIIFFGIVYGNDMSVLMNFVDVPSLIITVGGSTICMYTQAKSIPEFLNNLKSFKIALKSPNFNEAEVINNVVNLSNVARKEGLLALEETANNIEDEFLKKGIMLIVDGTDPELVRNIMETELASLETRHNDKVGFWANWAGMGPAWGMIGTLIGLVNMLYNMSDSASIGPAMAVALLTTLYGSIMANAIFVPVSFKMKMYSGMEVSIKEMMVEGLLSIQAGENPRVIEEKLKSFLAPWERDSIGEDAGGGAGAAASAGGGEG